MLHHFAHHLVLPGMWGSQLEDCVILLYSDRADWILPLLVLNLMLMIPALFDLLLSSAPSDPMTPAAFDLPSSPIDVNIS